MNLLKKDFRMIIESIREQYDYDKKRAQELSDIYGADVNPNDNSFLLDALFGVLHLSFPPLDNGFCSISTFCYELDFGRDSGISVDFDCDPIDSFWDSLHSL